MSSLPEGVRDRLAGIPRLHPAQTVVSAFGGVIAVGTILLLLPISSVHHTSVVDALFTSTSAVTVTGLTVVDTATHWSVTGQVILLVLVQAGGFGIMTFASVLSLLVARRLGMRSRLRSAAEGRDLGGSDLSAVLRGAFRLTLWIEGTIALALSVRWFIAYDADVGEALWHGVFHSVMAFNNAGFTLSSTSMSEYASDPWICLPVAVAVIIGGVGFPVLFELWRTVEFPRPRRRTALSSGRAAAAPARRWVAAATRRRQRWSLNTTLVLFVSTALLIAGTVWTAALEWSNPQTLGALDPPARVMAAFFHSTMARSGGFNTVDVGAMNPATLLGTDILMFIGGGPASTASGIKVTTFAVLTAIVISEARGDGAVNAFGKRLPRSVQRQAMTVAALGVFGVITGTMVLMLLADFGLDRSLFEAVSAFSTTGLSTGITADLPGSAQLVLAVMMFAGRLGPVTVASAIALRRQTRLYEYPKERPIIG